MTLKLKFPHKTKYFKHFSIKQSDLEKTRKTLKNSGLDLLELWNTHDNNLCEIWHCVDTNKQTRIDIVLDK